MSWDFSRKWCPKSASRSSWISWLSDGSFLGKLCSQRPWDRQEGPPNDTVCRPVSKNEIVSHYHIQQRAIQIQYEQTHRISRATTSMYVFNLDVPEPVAYLPPKFPKITNRKGFRWQWSTRGSDTLMRQVSPLLARLPRATYDPASCCTGEQTPLCRRKRTEQRKLLKSCPALTMTLPFDTFFFPCGDQHPINAEFLMDRILLLFTQIF